jgi:hypothetical protein
MIIAVKPDDKEVFERALGVPQIIRLIINDNVISRDISKNEALLRQCFTIMGKNPDNCVQR